MPSLSFFVSVSSIAVLILAIIILYLSFAEGAVPAFNETAKRIECAEVNAKMWKSFDEEWKQNQTDWCVKTAKNINQAFQDLYARMDCN